MIYQGEGVEVFSGNDGQERIGPTDWSNYLLITGFRIYYAVGELWALTSIDGATDEWDQVSDRDVLAVVVKHDRGRCTIIQNYDWYCLPNKTRQLKGRVIPDAIWESHRLFIAKEVGYLEGD